MTPIQIITLIVGGSILWGQRVFAWALLAAYVVCALLGWDWDRPNDRDERAQKRHGEVRSVFVVGHNGSDT